MRFLRPLFLFCCVLSLALPVQAARPQNYYTVKSAVESLPVLDEMRELWPSTCFQLTKEHGRDLLVGRVLITPHWEFKVTVPIQTPEWDKPIQQAGLTEITFSNIEEITIDMYGVPQPRYTIPETVLSTSEWVRLYQAKGDFRAINIELVAGGSILNLDAYLEYLEKNCDYR
ncbi:MAG: hypothetical protein JW739_04910 [Opitutales bacterium]|nr:hypothetical protein [Opitutales bacterium]